VPTFLPIYQSALVINDLITADLIPAVAAAIGVAPAADRRTS
jgi:hypothetical protein